MTRRRSWVPLTSTLLTAVVCMAMQLVLAGASSWHHHEGGEAPHDDCAVCVAVTAEKTDGLPPPVLLPMMPEVVGVIAMPAVCGAHDTTPRDCPARGPPAA